MNIIARNVNSAYIDGLAWLKVSGIREESRGGNVIVSPEPVMNTYTDPWERVLFNKDRDANPFFHLAEAIWMLAGSNQVEWLAQFNENIRQFSDNGTDFHGAYGFRWREHFGIDQLRGIAATLQLNPGTRQLVLAMWDPTTDLCHITKDVPCNTHIYFRTRRKKLDMTVCCRSNDAVWGCYGANVVHFSMLHEVLASTAQLEMGRYYQFSNNFHIYERHWDLMAVLPAMPENPYNYIHAIPLFAGGATMIGFLSDCEDIAMYDRRPIHCKFLCEVAWPLLNYYTVRKENSHEPFPKGVPDCDWKTACNEWITRRIK